MKILIVSSVGGHLDEVSLLLDGLREHECTLVVNDRCSPPSFPFSRVYRISHAERDWRVLLNFHECARILLAERPDVVLSAGAGPAVPMMLLSRLAGARTVFVETAASVSTMSMTGRMLRHVADAFFVQWPGLVARYPGTTLARLVFR